MFPAAPKGGRRRGVFNALFAKPRRQPGGFLVDPCHSAIRSGIRRCTRYVEAANRLDVLETCKTHKADLQGLATWVNNNSDAKVYLRSDVSEKDMLAVITILCSFDPTVRAYPSHEWLLHQNLMCRLLCGSRGKYRTAPSKSMKANSCGPISIWLSRTTGTYTSHNAGDAMVEKMRSSVQSCARGS